MSICTPLVTFKMRNVGKPITIIGVIHTRKATVREFAIREFWLPTTVDANVMLRGVSNDDGLLPLYPHPRTRNNQPKTTEGCVLYSAALDRLGVDLDDLCDNVVETINNEEKTHNQKKISVIEAFCCFFW